MKGVKLLIAGCAVAAIAVLAAGTSRAGTERFATDKPTAIVMFPKVVNNSNTKTVIQVTNTSNMPVNAHCFYTNAARGQWQINDFGLSLTRQQPTHWCVSDGRTVDPLNEPAGLDPGSIPPAGEPFEGALVCVEVDSSGFPVGSNSLKGEATLSYVNDNGEVLGVSKYNGIGIEARQGSEDKELKLDNTEYAACPGGAHLNFVAEGAEDDTLNTVSTTVSFLPCNLDFANAEPTSLDLKFDFYNEFEGHDSRVPVPVECYASYNIGEEPLFLDETGVGSRYGYSLITPADDSGSGFVAVANTARTTRDGLTSTAATNLHFFGNNDTQGVSGVIRIP